MAKIIAIANQKGGVGKTTTCVNLTAALHSMDYRVLMVDSDPQGNGSSGMGVKKTTRPNTYDLLINQVPPEDCVVHTPYGDLIPTGKELAAASVELINRENREFVLKNALQQLYADYDYILIDCPPSLELLTVDALEGIVLTMYDARANLTNQVAGELRKHLGDKVYQTVIPRSIRLSEAPSHGIPGVLYDKSNKGSKAYMALAAEFAARCR